ncbi:MAG: STAS domain-containing protein [Candidatus Xenobia bacterium]
MLHRDHPRPNLMARHVGEICLVTVPHPELDGRAARAFGRDVVPLLATSRHAVFDLASVQRIGSLGLAAILEAQRRLQGRHGDLKLCSLTRPVRQLFEAMQLHRTIDIFNSAEDACQAFDTP